MKTEAKSDCEIVTSRVLDASRERVWSAMTDPKQLTLWWGPVGFHVDTLEFNFKPGGFWRHEMVGPDGAVYPNTTKFVEIVPREKLVYENGGGCKGGPGVSFHGTWTLKDLGGKTELTIRLVFDSRNDRDFVNKEFKADEGAVQTLARLAEHVTKSGDFVISRLLNAPREAVWKAWTEPEKMARWFGPKGVKTRSLRLELKPGGVYHYALETPDGKEMWGRWMLREVTPPSRLVFVNSFSDPDLGLTRHPLNPAWPLEMLSIITFEDKGGKTLLTVSWAAINATESERKTFDSGHDSMNAGWGGTLENLEGYLKEAK